MKKNTVKKNQLALKGGSYSLIITATLLAILIVVNIFASNMPTTLTKFDISASKLYSITSNTKAIVNNLKQDVTIYWIVQADQEDTIIENLLGKYDGLSSRIDVVKKNPDVFPTFAQQYTDETVQNNSLIVVSGERSRYISLEEIYEFEYEYDYYSYSYVATGISGFDGERVITSAIDYVVTEDLPTLYILEGHGEETLPTAFSDAVSKDNILTSSLSLPTVDTIPEDADCILIYAPQSDISQEEATMLTNYTQNGGKLLIIAGPVEDAYLSNLDGLLTDYGVQMVDGIVIEGDRSSYAFGYPYVLMPWMGLTSITSSLEDEGYSPILPLAQGMYLEDPDNGMVTEVLYTSDDSFSKVAGFALDTYEKEENDIDGPFTLAVLAENDSGGQILRFSSSDFLQDVYNSYSSGANVNLVMNALSSLIGEREAISIRVKSIDYSYLTIDEETSSTLKLMMIGIFPLAYLGLGIGVIVSKRRK